MNNLVDKARHLPLHPARQTISISPVRLPVPGRSTPLELRITTPADGGKRPVILLSHGMGPSLYIASKDGYGPLAHFLAEQGFLVIQPTHASSRVGGLPANSPGAPLFWRERVLEMKLVLDGLDTIEAEVPLLSGRLDHDRIAAVGHSMGGQTVGMLLGARLSDPRDPDAQDVDLSDKRIRAGVLLAAPGLGGDSLSEFARENYSALNPDFSHMTTPTLVVAGDADENPHLNVRGYAWHTDPFVHGPGAEALLLLRGGKHGLGGIAGYDAKETDDEDPDRLAATLRMTAAWLRTALGEDADAWNAACRALAEQAPELGSVERR
ncbi:alpha/beta hydrolase family protein [Martelella limonii]|uniref:alpha/beta hydrolase family protein n=1 Tax=Martelella limonii TaxID=1647649 RepID=UPI001580EF4E|nr:alpha/beta fold hydrolase [Martelella limonii]